MAKKPVVKATDEPNLDETVETTPQSDSVLSADASEETLEVIEPAAPKKKSSFSSKALGAIALLLLGGAAALYGGPKLAPMLPSGMAPVANFLSPGEATATDKIKALRSDIDLRLQALENAKAPDVSAQFDALSADMNARITGLSDQMAATDGRDIESRLTGVETKLAGLVAQMDSLNQGLAGMQTGESSADLTGYQAVIDGLKAEVAALSSKQGLIGQRIEEVTATTDRRVEQANATISDITRAKAISDIGTALESGAGFGDALATLSEGGVDVPAALSDASAGVTTLAALKADFSAAAHAGLKASVKQETSEGLAGKLTGFLKSQVTVRSLEPQEGTSTDAVLSRVQGALDNEDLAGALSEATGLDDAAKSVMEIWLSAAKTRQAALDAVATLSAN